MSPFGWWKIQVLDELKDDIKFTSRIICASHNMDDEQSSALILQLEGPASGALPAYRQEQSNVRCNPDVEDIDIQTEGFSPARHTHVSEPNKPSNSCNIRI